MQYEGGENNLIEVISPEHINNLSIYIQGCNNYIKLEKYVEVSKELDITICGNDCQIIIDSGTSIESAQFACADDNNKIKIGKECMFASQIKIFASDFHSVIDVSSGERINYSKEIKIGNHVWVGNSSILTKNIDIADNVIIAMGSVVTKSVFQSNVVIGGNPAKIIKENVNWDRQRF